MSSRGMCARNAVFSHTELVSESKIANEMLCFTIETAVGGCKGGRCETAGAAMIAYVRLWSAMVGSVRHWEVQSQAVKRIVMVASRWRWIVDGGAVLLGNAIAGFHGDAVLLGNVIAGCRVVMVASRSGLGCRWWRRIVVRCFRGIQLEVVAL